MPSPDATAQPVNDMTKRMMQAIYQATQRRQLAAHPVPMQVPAVTDAENAQRIGMNTANPHAWGTQRFLAGLSANIKNAVTKHKQDQLLKAEGDWTYAQAALNELYNAQQSGDQKAVEAAQNKVNAVLGDPKKLKNMAKALNQDWLNPEKTTVYGEALKKVISETNQKDIQKGQAKQGLMGIFKRLIQRQPQPQLNPEQSSAMAQEIQAKAPTTSPGVMSIQDIEKAAKAVHDMAVAEKDLRAAPEKYEFKAVRQADGSEKIVAMDKTNPHNPYIEVRSEAGEVATKAGKQYAGEGKLEVIGGIPTGRVQHQGRFVAPGQPGYTADDKKAIDMAMNAANLSEKQKEKLAAIRGSSYAIERATYTPIAVVDNETGEAVYAPMIDVARNPGKYVQPNEAEKISARDAVHRSLKANFGALEKDLGKLPSGLDTKTQATIALALQNDNPGVLETLLVSKVKENAPDEVLRYLTDIKAMQEDILVLRSVGGMGQGSDMMRQAMIRTIPGAGTSSVKEANMQLQAAQRTSESLFAGRTRAKFSEGGEGAGVETRIYNGAVYERPKGSGGQWKLRPKAQ